MITKCLSVTPVPISSHQPQPNSHQIKNTQAEPKDNNKEEIKKGPCLSYRPDIHVETHVNHIAKAGEVQERGLQK